MAVGPRERANDNDGRFSTRIVSPREIYNRGPSIVGTRLIYTPEYVGRLIDLSSEDLYSAASSSSFGANRYVIIYIYIYVR